MKWLQRIPNIYWYISCVALLIVSLFSHLGFLPIDVGSDEPRRALVALEMLLSGDYLTPTLNGVPYFNKPPLYNWLIVASFKLWGDYSSFTVRFPMLVSLLFYGYTIFWFVKQHTSSSVAFLSALVFVTNGRILFYDSLQGLIDITFSWLTYTAFMLVFLYYDRKNLLMLFVSTYILTALGFLMKGLPSVVFQGITLLTFFVWKKDFRRLFTWQHIAGVLCFLLITGSYYTAYFLRNEIPIEKLFGVLLSESAKRTVVKFGVGETLLHILTFPFEMLYHYAPWMWLVLVFFRKGIFKIIQSNPFITFNLLIFLTNFIIYWTSPQVYARYLLMLLPLLFTPFVWLYTEKTLPNQWQRKTLDYIFGSICILLCIGTWAFPFIPQTQLTPNVWVKTALLFILFTIVTIQYLQQASQRLFYFVFVLVVARIGFNWFILPPRLAYPLGFLNPIQQQVDKTKSAKLFAYKNTIKDDGSEDFASYQIAAIRGEILRNTNSKIPNAFYLADSSSLVSEQYISICDSLQLDDDLTVKLVKFK